MVSAETSADRRDGGGFRLGRYRFKRAERDGELSQLHLLNFATFVREVPQHADPGTGALVDKFHDKNAYFIALDGRRVVGMVAVHDRPPFSIADKLEDPSVLAAMARPLEVRLLAIDPDHRQTSVFAGLTWLVLRHAREHGHAHLLISGLADRERMYQRLGFRPLGPAVDCGDARFLPMAARVDAMPDHVERSAGLFARRLAGRRPARRERRATTVRARPRRAASRPAAEPAITRSFSPGVATLSPEVARALASPLLSHRGEEFLSRYGECRSLLSELAGGQPVALFGGSGTLANEVVAAQLAADRRRRRGLVLVNGEFGRRLVHQARRAGLDTDVLAWDWGRSWDIERVAEALEGRSAPGWVWAVHLESSTGMLNDVAALGRLCVERDVELCLDCVSSLGAVPLDLSAVRLASGVANKTLGGVAGLSMVFAAPGALEPVDAERVPVTLDLPAALAAEGPRFTLASGPVLALRAALQAYAGAAACRARYREVDRLGRRVRSGLEALGLSPLVRGPGASPQITTFAAPPGVCSSDVVAACEQRGLLLGGESGYLRERNWLQVATMGHVDARACGHLLTVLGAALDGGA